MKNVFCIFTAILLLGGGIAFAQDVSVSYSARTGDRGFDSSLSQLNMEARSDMDGFMTRLSVSTGVQRTRIQMMIREYDMQPADCDMALRISTVTKQPVERVIEQYQVNRNRGWGVIAKNMGIKPGSREFHALKKDLSGKGQGKGHKNDKKKGRGWDRDED